MGHINVYFYYRSTLTNSPYLTYFYCFEDNLVSLFLYIFRPPPYDPMPLPYPPPLPPPTPPMPLVKIPPPAPVKIMYTDPYRDIEYR